MREYYNLYLKTDVRLLADVFKKFRDLCLNGYALTLIMLTLSLQRGYHKMLTFKQQAWLKPYIEFNINKRKLAKIKI